MKTAVIAVGKEVLTGKTVNTNLTYIARKLKEIGVDVSRSFVIDDTENEFFKILDIIDEELLIFSGGLGPTNDDITRETVLKYFECDTYLDEFVLNDIKQYFQKMNLDMAESNHKQALFPKQGVLLENSVGTAPGLYFEAKGKIVILLPGPPSELQPMFNKVLYKIQEKVDVLYYTNGFKVVGIGESDMETKLQELYQKHHHVNIAPYASLGEVAYVFTGTNEDDVLLAMADFFEQFHTYIYGGLEDTLEGIVVDMLIQENLTISTVESCTGGLLAGAITSVSGSSFVFKEGLITYSNEAKMKYVNVSEKTLQTKGAVSEETVLEMAKNLQKQTTSDITVSISGIAGPTGGSEDKPVGLVHFAVCFQEKVITKHRIFNGDRNKIRQRSVIYALDMIRKELVDAKNYY